MLAIEPEPLLVVGSSMEMIEMIDAVGSQQLAVNLDIGHAYLTDDDVVASIHQLGSLIVHLHLEDIRAHVHRHLTFGQGDIDLARVRCALEEIGYGGPYVADLFGIADEASSIAARALGGLKRWFG
jgi:protein FrlC